MNHQASHYSNQTSNRRSYNNDLIASSPSNARLRVGNQRQPNTPTYQNNYGKYYSPHNDIPNSTSGNASSSYLKYLHSDEEDSYPPYRPTISTPKNMNYSYYQGGPMTPTVTKTAMPTIYSDHSNYSTPSNRMAGSNTEDYPQPVNNDRPFPIRTTDLYPSRGYDEEYYSYNSHTPYADDIDYTSRYNNPGYYTPTHTKLHQPPYRHPMTPHGYPSQPLPSPSHQMSKNTYYNPPFPEDMSPRRMNYQFNDFSYQTPTMYEPIDTHREYETTDYIKPPMINTNFNYSMQYPPVSQIPIQESEGYEETDEFYYQDQPPTFHRPQMRINTSFDNENYPSYERGSKTTRYADYMNMPSSYLHTHLVSPSPSHCRSLGNTPRSLVNNQVRIESTSPRDSLRYLKYQDITIDDSPVSNHIDIISLPLWNYPPYQEIWRSLDATKKNYHASSFISTQEEELIRKRIDEGIEKKKNCQFRQARLIFIELIIQYPSYLQIWLEFTRLEMECGEYQNASHVLESALTQHQHNELLLQKKIRVEERLNHIKPIQSIIEELRELDTQKAMKIIMEGVAVVARMGYEIRASSYYESIVKKSRFFTGNFFMELMLFEEHYGSHEKLMKMVDEALEKYPKYGPLWFYCFELIEHNCMIQWNYENLNSRDSRSRYEDYMERAIASLTSDLLWKVYFIRIQFWCRSILYIRSAVVKNSSLYYELSKTERDYWLEINQDTELCLQKCPDNLKWKFFMILGRFSAISGYQVMSTKLFTKAFACCPDKSKQQVLLDYSKATFFTNNLALSSSLLTKAKLLFPSEWKLELESIQQLIQQGYIKEALLMNYHALKNHIGAGRLWSSCIQLTHQLFGPEIALKVFKRALRHVAKSGEVWCEGCRIYLNPCSSLFSTTNALKCLNYAVFFTPQYGDSFIEILRFMIICSDRFLTLHSISNPGILASILCSYTPILHFIKRYSFYDPNYGPLWFRCKEFLLAPAKEVLYRSVYIVALEIALNADLYYEALKYQSSNVSGKATNFDTIPVALRSRFSTAIRPDYMYDHKIDSNSYKRKVQILYGASQMDY